MRVKRILLSGCLITFVACYTHKNKLQEVRSLPCNKNELKDCLFVKNKTNIDLNVMNQDQSKMSEILQNFNGMSVKNYEKSIINNKHSLGVVPSPSEFDEVIKAGRAIVPLLIQNLQNDDEFLKFASLDALQIITKRSFGYTSIYKHFKNREIVDKEEWIACKSEWLIWWEKNKDKPKIQWLVDSIENKDPSIILAINELGELGDKSVIPLLRTLLNEQGLVKDRAIRALGLLEDGYIIPHLIDQYLNNEMEQYRCQGIVMLRNITGETLCYDPKASNTDREESIKLWKYWWEQNKHKY